MRFQGVLFASDFDSALASSDERLRPAVLRAIDRFIPVSYTHLTLPTM